VKAASLLLLFCLVASAGAYNLTEGMNANLSIWDTTDLLQVDKGEVLHFFANYTNSTDPINGTDVYCEFTTDGNGSWSLPVNMTFNESSGLYELETSISRAGNHTFNVTCDGSSQLYDILQASDSVDIQFSLVSLCSAGCDYSDLTSALLAAESSASRIVINSSGEYTADGPSAYNLNATNLGAISVESDDVVIDCNFSSIKGNSSGYAIYMNGYSNITVRNCIISNYSKAILARYTNSGIFSNLNISSNAEGLHLATANTACIVENSTFSLNDIAIQFDTTNSSIIKNLLITDSTEMAIRFESSNNNLIKDTVMSGSSISDVYTIQDSNNTLLNVTFSSAHILAETGWLYVSYYVDAQLNDSFGNPVEGMSVVLNDTSRQVFAVSTSLLGLIARQNVTAYYRNNESVYNLSPFTVLAFNSTHSSYVHSFNMSGNINISITIDTNAPIISSVFNSSITNQSAIISWSTDDQANASLNYGTSITLGSIHTNTSRATSHAISLSGLMNSTVYYYNITSCNHNGYCSVQGLYSFRTLSNPDSTPPIISGLFNTTTNETSIITFTTDDSANSTVKYGTTPALLSSSLNSSFLTEHNITLSGLQNSTLYYYNITVCNSDGYCETYGTYNMTTEQNVDITAPVISNVANLSITNASAIITWTTDDLANSTVRYGTTVEVLSAISNSSLATNHAVTLLGLINSTLYYYNVSSCNSQGLCSVSQQYSFTTMPSIDTVAPVISGVLNTSITGTSAVISWTTNEASNGTVHYGTSSGSYTLSAINSSYLTLHTVTLSGLSSETTFYYVVNSSDYSNNSAVSAEYSFTTKDITAPSITDVANSTIGDSFALVTWTTGEASTTVVKYGTVSGSYVYSYSNLSLVTSHSANLTGLASGTYYYVVNSSDASGNSNQSPEYSFTIVDKFAPGISIISPVNGSLVSDWGNVVLSVVTTEISTCILTAYKLGTSTASPSSVMITSGNLTHTLYFNASADSNGFDNYFSVSCRDATGNTNSSITYFSLNDTTAPSLTFYSPTPSNNGYLKVPNITVNFTVNEPMASSFPKLSFKGGTNETVLSSGGFYIYAKASQEDGSYNFTVYASDIKGNVRAVTRSFNIDTEEPTMTVVRPKKDEVYSDCRNISFNVTVSEQASCEFTLYGDSKDSHEACIADCKAVLKKCLADADDDEEEDECEQDYDDCSGDCSEGRFSKVDSDDMEESGAFSACKDKCKDTRDTCFEKCGTEKDKCLSDAETSSERAECSTDYDVCYSDCSDDYSGCNSDCASGDWYYVYAYSDCLTQGLYVASFLCEDLAGNAIDKNISFSVLDKVPPRITEILPKGEIESDSATLKVTTDERGTCRASLENKDFLDMEMAFVSAGTVHTYQLSGLKEGTHTYYVLCNDSAGNVMPVSEKAVFTVKLARSDTARQVTSGTFTIPRLEKDVPYEIEIKDISSPVVSIKVTVSETLNNAGFKVSKVSDTSNIKKPDKVVFDYFEITRENIPADKLKEAIVKFRVQKAWMDANRIDNAKVSLLRYTSQWDILETIFLSSDASGFTYEAKTPGFSVFSVAGEQFPMAPEEKKANLSEESPTEIEESSGWIWILILCVVVVGGGSAYYYVVSHRHPQQDSYAESQIRQTQSSEAAAVQPAAAPRDSVDEYILGCHHAGMSVDDIRDSLVQAGHLPEDIEPRFAYLGILYDAAADSEVLQYVRDSIKDGMDKSTIRKELMKVGHSEAEVERVFQVIENPVEKAQEVQVSTGDELMDYIIAAMKAGISRSEIELNLVSAGFSQRDVQKKMLEIDAGSAPAEDSSELMEYIQLSLSKGMSPEDIRRSLLQLGMNEAEVDAAMQRFAS